GALRRLVVETAVILNQASERALVILDEIGRGTAPFYKSPVRWRVPLLSLVLAALLAIGVAASGAAAPTSVTIAGSLQSELGCSGDWQPDCAATHLTYDASDDVWQRTFSVPTGSWEY